MMFWVVGVRVLSSLLPEIGWRDNLMVNPKMVRRLGAGVFAAKIGLLMFLKTGVRRRQSRS